MKTLFQDYPLLKPYIKPIIQATAYLLQRKKARIPGTGPNSTKALMIKAQRSTNWIRRPNSVKNRKPQNFNNPKINARNKNKITIIVVNIAGMLPSDS